MTATIDTPRRLTPDKEVTEVEPADQAPLPSPTCPLCHTLDHTITSRALAAGGTWRCTRCGQQWTAERLRTAAAYAQYAERLVAEGRVKAQRKALAVAPITAAATIP
jgi:ribosomal protein L37AE/L43A